MAPFVYNFQNNKYSAFDNPYLDKNDQPLYTTAEPRSAYDKEKPASNIFLAAAGAGTVFGAGFIPVNNKRVWDYYTSFLRNVEEYSPGQILRTFQLSTFASQFESRTFTITPLLLRENFAQLNHLMKVIGDPVTIYQGRKISTFQRLLLEGITFRGGKAYWGTGDDVAIKYASFFASPEATNANLASAYVRSIGSGEFFTGKAGSFLSRERPFGFKSKVRNPAANRLVFTAQGGQSIFEYATRQLGALGTESVSRFNRLLAAPFEIEPLASMSKLLTGGIEKITGKPFSFAVKEGPGTEMLMRLSAKYGIGLSAAILGYQTLDWAVREATPEGFSIFDEGITAGFGTLWAKGNILASRAAETVGLHNYREKQEEIAPGSTSLIKLVGIPLATGFMGATAAFLARTKNIYAMQKKGMDILEARETVDILSSTFPENNLLDRLGKQLSRQEGLYSEKNIFGKLIKKLARPDKTGELVYKGIGKLGRVKLTGLLATGLGIGFALPFLPGALVPSERPDKLERIYSGEEQVPVRKGRWWLPFGRSDFEGAQVQYFRQHWLPRLINRPKEKAIWEEQADINPISKFIKREFTYELEQRHPDYPVSSLPFQDVPLIGDILAMTIGRAIKPEKYIRQDEWLTPEGALVPSKGYGQAYATELGEIPGPVPESPYSTANLFGQQVYRFQEMAGLFGFAAGSIKEKITGTEQFFNEYPQLESARRMFGTERTFWETEIGDPGFTELLRRFFPHRIRSTQLYNPLKSEAPSWLPGEGERSPNFQEGSLYTKVKMGEERLPGPGYAALYPELEGVDPKDYSLIHRYNILCLDKDTFIPTEEGIKKIKDITSEDKVFGSDGNYQKVSCILKREEIDTSISISTFYNYLPLICTDKHKILVTDKHKEIKEISAKEVTKENYLLFPKLKFLNKKSHICIGDYTDVEKTIIKYVDSEYLAKDKGSFYFIKFNLLATHQLGRIFGLFLAEGNVSTNKVTWSFNKTEQNSLGKEIRDFAKYLGVTYHDRITTSNSYQISINNKLLSKFFYNLFSSGSANKKIKLDILNYSKDFVKGIISGYLDGDGYIAQTSRTFSCRASSVSFTLLSQIRYYCLGLGVVASIRERKSRYSGNKAWVLDIQRRDIHKLDLKTIHYYEQTRFNVSTSERLNFELEDYIAIRVKEVKEIDAKSEWYDISLAEDIHLFSTLVGLVHNSDVAPYADRTKFLGARVKAIYKSGKMSERDAALFEEIQRQQKIKNQLRTNFREYNYLSPTGKLTEDEVAYTASNDSAGLVAAINESYKQTRTEKRGGLFERTVGGFWEGVTRAVESPYETLTPVAPAAKFIHARSALEDYKKAQVYSKEMAMWQNPVENFLKPFINTMGNIFGNRDVPENVQTRRNIESYFDTLKYIKYARLANQARIEGDKQKIAEFEQKKDETLFGINPYTFSFTKIYRALPKAERDYFKEFSSAQSEEERQEILNYIPENEIPLYVAKWKQNFASEVEKLKKAEVLSDQQIAEAEALTAQIRKEASTEGFPQSQELLAEYAKSRLKGENYADWYRRVILLKDTPFNIPGPNWIGWTEADLDDIKLQLVQHLGENMYDYNLWGDRLKSLAYKPYINDASLAPLIQEDQLTDEQKQQLVTDIIKGAGGRVSMSFTTMPSSHNFNENHIYIEQERRDNSILSKIFGG